MVILKVNNNNNEINNVHMTILIIYLMTNKMNNQSIKLLLILKIKYLEIQVLSLKLQEKNKLDYIQEHL